MLASRVRCCSNSLSDTFYRLSVSGTVRVSPAIWTAATMIAARYGRISFSVWRRRPRGTRRSKLRATSNSDCTLSSGLRVALNCAGRSLICFCCSLVGGISEPSISASTMSRVSKNWAASCALSAAICDLLVACSRVLSAMMVRNGWLTNSSLPMCSTAFCASSSYLKRSFSTFWGLFGYGIAVLFYCGVSPLSTASMMVGPFSSSSVSLDDYWWLPGQVLFCRALFFC